EVVAPFLLVAPLLALRRLGVLVQVPLQLGIMLTGNYNWFNLHTLALLVPAWARDDLFPRWREPLLLRFLAYVAGLAGLCLAFRRLFPLEVLDGGKAASEAASFWRSSSNYSYFYDMLTAPDAAALRNELTPAFLQRRILDVAFSLTAVSALYVVIVADGVAYALSSSSSSSSSRSSRVPSSLLRATTRLVTTAGAVGLVSHGGCWQCHRRGRSDPGD
ncbi:MAG: lipase maturation factor family protein, partial [Bacteroidota bacterium]